MSKKSEIYLNLNKRYWPNLSKEVSQLKQTDRGTRNLPLFGNILYSPFLRNGQNVALLWPKHSPNMVPQIGSFLI